MLPLCRDSLWARQPYEHLCVVCWILLPCVCVILSIVWIVSLLPQTGLGQIFALVISTLLCIQGVCKYMDFLKKAKRNATVKPL